MACIQEPGVHRGLSPERVCAHACARRVIRAHSTHTRSTHSHTSSYTPAHTVHIHTHAHTHTHSHAHTHTRSYTHTHTHMLTHTVHTHTHTDTVHTHTHTDTVHTLTHTETVHTLTHTHTRTPCVLLLPSPATLCRHAAQSHGELIGPLMSSESAGRPKMASPSFLHFFPIYLFICSYLFLFPSSLLLCHALSLPPSLFLSLSFPPSLFLPFSLSFPPSLLFSLSPSLLPLSLSLSLSPFSRLISWPLRGSGGFPDYFFFLGWNMKSIKTEGDSPLPTLIKCNNAAQAAGERTDPPFQTMTIMDSARSLMDSESSLAWTNKPGCQRWKCQVLVSILSEESADSDFTPFIPRLCAWPPHFPAVKDPPAPSLPPTHTHSMASLRGSRSLDLSSLAHIYSSSFKYAGVFCSVGVRGRARGRPFLTCLPPFFSFFPFFHDMTFPYINSSIDLSLVLSLSISLSLSLCGEIYHSAFRKIAICVVTFERLIGLRLSASRREISLISFSPDVPHLTWLRLRSGQQ